MTKPSIIAGRRWLTVLVAGVTLAGSTLLSAAPGHADEALVIPDIHFQNCLDSALSKADGESVTAIELATITQLSCDYLEISDLTGAKYLTNIEDLSLVGNSITTLDGLDGFAPANDPLSINLTSNKISDLSALNQFTGTTVYADAQTWELGVLVGQATTVGIVGRSGASITDLTPAWDWPSFTIAGAKVTAGEAGLIDVNFSDPQECRASADCTDPEYTFNGTVTVTATAEFTATPAPAISGTAALGETLTAEASDWTPVQLDWAYQWYRDDVEIAGADASTYTVTTDDIGTSLRVAVTGILDGYSGPWVKSPAVTVAGPEFTATPAPTISGTVAQGETLTAHVSGWSPTPDDWAYQWYRGDTEIAGADESTYTVAADDAGSRLKVAVTGTKSGYAPATATSLPTVEVPNKTFTTVTRPTITGTVAAGMTLTAQVSGWVPTPDGWAYQWNHDGAAIPGATKSTYLLEGTDGGKQITVTVTGTKTGYTSTSQTSLATIKVAVGRFTTVRPTITGTLRVGQTLTATAPGWTPTADHWYYRWYRNNKAISHATKSTYTLVAADWHKRITVRMTAVKTGFITARRTSMATSKVLRGQFVAPAPTITGDPKVGSTLRVVSTGWAPTPSSLHRQWYRDGKKISRATRSTYRLVAADLGHSITVKVTGARKRYVSMSKTSAALLIGG